MNEDLISGFSVSDVNKSLLKKNSRLALILLTFSGLYFLFESKYWYDVLVTSGSKVINAQHAFYLYKIAPVISFIEMVIGILIAFIYFNAWKNQSAALEAEDVLLFNKSIKLFNAGLVLNLAYFLLAFLRMFLHSLYYK